MVSEAVSLDRASVKRDHTDRLLDLVEADVRDRRELVEELDEWDRFSLNSYIADLSLLKDRYARLEDQYENQTMTDEQRSRFKNITYQREKHEANLETILNRCKQLRSY